ncbi:hypothetical protein SMACR_06044 [Sordaria macrospora]|uniref:WGS project CABT00000000 data, contig 2.32 n=2 Tax=Sordaria macrospora TaxID=5147 RepID=F7W5W4_SORMK|nr:uncharacterized protein SMAC_06044 [Sordaria macrospora k-hell]KAA8629524.1 hypothetical protein SMACR_06044 [Sordaria macrospora]KAH7628134.1 hypothetical protein B0T09DRAFT_375862 [Sordaria sp. MPI-SDFR-AT-0083]WPJ65587.1 hypothetical protein SMAC4_06044 [Sordaria macrospora]CCC12902.1 unnamed protein product [Sordaria macrospora k-hell]
MVNYRFLTLAALALPLVAAAPTASASETLEVRSEHEVEVFSFEKWVDSIIANPDTALSSEQAIEAWKASTNGTSSAATDAAGTLSKRSCMPMADQAYVPDAVVCINKLASLGSQACVANAVAFFWTHGRAQVVGVAGPVAYVSTTCQKVAQTAGKIMDQCTSGQFTGGQIPNVGDSRMQVHLRLP